MVNVKAVLVDLVCVFAGFVDLRKYSEGVLAYLSVGGGGGSTVFI